MDARRSLPDRGPAHPGPERQPRSLRRRFPMRRFLAIVVAVGLLVVGAAIAAADTCAPGKVTDLAVDGMGKSTVVLTCTAPGDDCSTGTAATFEIRASQSGPITESNYYNATVILTGTAPTGGSSQC